MDELMLDESHSVLSKSDKNKKELKENNFKSKSNNKSNNDDYPMLSEMETKRPSKFISNMEISKGQKILFNESKNMWNITD